ncbi:unnamed protein product [Auanema sp. JU1783]|nr:unnamed protein product [Auanema sp. JU1783]
MIIKLPVISFLIFHQISQCHARGKRIDIFTQDGGDMVQLKGRNHGKDVMYNALPRNSQYKWNTYPVANNNYVIPYRITGAYDELEKATIAEAIARIENNTCLKFKVRTNEQDFIDIQNERYEGCYTSVGRVPGINILMLESNEAATCIETDIVMHELMHSIGLWHEHMRYDRDDYITVLFENIEAPYKSQFDKVTEEEATTFNVPYDYTSVMHYAETAFAKKDKISMRTKDPKFQKVIGHQRDASPSDYQKICLLYGCDKCMGRDFNEQTVLTRGTDESQTDNSGVGLPPVTMPEDNFFENIDCTDVFETLCPALVQNRIVKCSASGDDTYSACCASCSRQRESKSAGTDSSKGILQSLIDMIG